MIAMENNATLKDQIIEAMNKRFESLEKKMDDGFQNQGLLLESIQNDIETLVDGQDMLHARIDRVQNTVFNIDEKVERLDARLTGVEIA
jgi:predicted  nucleic acid-binding Zn-ribbon protein